MQIAVSEDLKKEFDVALSLFDKDGDGVYNLEEFKSAMDVMGFACSDEDLAVFTKEFFQKGVITPEKFMELITSDKVKYSRAGPDFKDSFNILDADSSEFITNEDLFRVMKSIDRTFDGESLRLDDFSISFEEFDEMI